MSQRATLVHGSRRSRNPPTDNPRIATLAGIAAVAAGAFARLVVLERDRRLSKEDQTALKKIAGSQAKHRRAAELLHPLGKWWSYVPAAAAVGVTVYARGRGPRSDRAAGAASVLLAAAASALVNPLFDKVLPQPPPPPGRRSNPKPTFPSGHAFGLGAVALASAYVLHREDVVGTAAAAPIALLPPVIGGVAKVVEQKHWPSEVAGGFLVAVVIASLSVLVYELERAQRAN
jgi:membrane-associated phospholipid phosphatase